MRTPLIWAGGLIGSIAAHGVAFAFLNISVEPDPIPTQPKPETQLSMDAYQVDRQDAPAQAANGEKATEADAQSTDLTQGAIPQSKSKAQAPISDKITNAPAPSETVTGTNQSAPAVKATAPNSNTVTAIQAPTGTLTAAPSITAEPTPAITSATQTITSLSAPQEIIQQAVLSQPLTTPRPAQSQTLSPTAATAIIASKQTPDAPNVGQTIPDPNPAQTLQPPSDQAAEPPLPSEFATASLAFNFGDRVVTDPDAIATIQAFMAPQTINGSKQVRDDLSALLSSVDCARLSATYIPETGALELRGHVPENALRAPVLKALQDQIGDGITVTDNLLHLPKPQCGALTGIANVGLAQSTDQLTNKRLIGDNAQAVEYTYTEGQPLAFDLTAPDYDAVVYVDYFDADGQVIHLVPNEVVGLQAYKAKEVVGIERGNGPKLNITIGPPFGQEIAVAFAASRPLYSGVRPVIEPAEPYLEFLKTQVAKAREIDPDFKGEWVYFFITTQPAG